MFSGQNRLGPIVTGALGNIIFCTVPSLCLRVQDIVLVGYDEMYCDDPLSILFTHLKVPLDL